MKLRRHEHRQRPALAAPCAVLLALLFTPALATAQGFESGSDESDGELTYTSGEGTITFDPATLGLDDDGDNVFHFTTITIPTGTTLVVKAGLVGEEGEPVVFLASGDVDIAGTLDVSGSAGHANTATPTPSTPGAGGFGGGESGLEPRAGNGPGGGKTAVSTSGGHASHMGVGTSTGAGAGATYGQKYLLPLIGGSGGGGGGLYISSIGGGGGGAGGGAILIASSTEISLTGSILAKGGDGAGGGSGYPGGDGSGGSVRLMADTISGTGTIDVRGGTIGINGGHGRSRVEAFKNTFRNTGAALPLLSITHASPVHIFPPASAPKVRVTTIDGVAAPAVGTGSFSPVDVVIDDAGEVTVEIEAENIPTGTKVLLTLDSEDGEKQTIESTGLSGTFESSTATAAVTFSSGFTRIFVSADWTP